MSVTQASLVAMIRERSYQTGDFTLASGLKSNFYLDLKETTLYPPGIELIAQLAVQKIIEWEQLRSQNILAVGGLTLGADPLATALSLEAWKVYQKKWQAVLIRKESKAHGTGKAFAGRACEGIQFFLKEQSSPLNPPIQSKPPMVILEDVVTTGGSSVQAIESARAAGLNPVLVLTVLDRQQGGAQKYAEMGLDFVSLVTLKEVVEL